MTVDLCPEVVTSKDGRYAILLEQFVGAGVYVDKSRTSFTFDMLPHPRGRSQRINVEIPTAWWETFARMLKVDSAVPPAQAPGASYLGAFVIGEHMDRHGPIPEVFADTVRIQNDPEHDYWNSVDDDGVMLYVGAKLYWAWKFASTPVIMNKADAFRLGTSREDLYRAATLGEGEFWTRSYDDDYGTTLYRYTPKLLREFSAGRFPGQIISPITEVQAKLVSPRYAAPRTHFVKAVQFLAPESLDPSNAVKEGVTAVESMCSIVLSRSGATLGQMIKDLRVSGTVPKPLDKIFEALWGFASEEAGARHGSASPPATSVGVATWVVNTSAAAILHLLELDRTKA